MIYSHGLHSLYYSRQEAYRESKSPVIAGVDLSCTPSYFAMDVSEEIKQILFISLMQRRWEEVMELYRQNPEVHTATVTKSGDTALHIAVSDAREDIVEELVSMLSSSEALKVKNKRTNTPLHLAASSGSARMCRCLASKDTTLMGARNDDGETPFFLAALHGKKKAFLCLHSFCGPDEGYLYSRRSDGNTILHCAILGEYFDLAFQIIHRCPNLVNSINGQGLSPLHVLATRPSAFRSRTHLGFFSKLIYHCTFVDNLKVEGLSIIRHQPLPSEDIEQVSYPENYRACIDFLKLIIKSFQIFATGTQKKKIDEELSNHQQGDTSERNHGQELLPSNYSTCFEIIKQTSKAIMAILKLGSRKITKMKRTKEKHVWCAQVMDKLLKVSSAYKYGDNGRKPGIYTSFFMDAEELVPELPLDEVFKGIERGMEEEETAFLLAARNGISEIVEKMLAIFPTASEDLDVNNRNAFLLAVEYRQPHICLILLNKMRQFLSIFKHTDKDGNSALHPAATLQHHTNYTDICGPALQMQQEISWYQFIGWSMPANFFMRYNKNGKTASDLFKETHRELLKSSAEWYRESSNSCSVVAALIATVAFATSATVPGGVDDKTGSPILIGQPAFTAFASTSLIALSFSVISLITFLSISTYPHHQLSFSSSLPTKFMGAVISLLLSIVAMLVSFCSSHFFELKDKLRLKAYPIYTLSCLVVSFFVFFQFSFYFAFLTAIIHVVPPRNL